MCYVISCYNKRLKCVHCFFVKHFPINFILVCCINWVYAMLGYYCIILKCITMYWNWYCTQMLMKIVVAPNLYPTTNMSKRLLKEKNECRDFFSFLLLMYCYVLLGNNILHQKWWLQMTKKPDSILFNQMNPMIW